MKLLALFTLFFLGCSTTDPKMVSNTGLDNVYISSGIEKFFLVDLPYWANFSKVGQCQRKSNIRFLHHENLAKSYDLKYSQLVHLQHMFNRKLYAYKTSAASSEIPLKDESYVFHNVYQQVIGGRYDFVPPRFEKVSVVWIDPYLADPKIISQKIKSNAVLEGHPILLSFCLNSYELEELSRDHSLDELGVKFLSADMMSIYDQDQKKNFFFSLNLSEFLHGKDITLFSRQKLENIQGQYKFIEIK